MSREAQFPYQMDHIYSTRRLGRVTNQHISSKTYSQESSENRHACYSKTDTCGSFSIDLFNLAVQPRAILTQKTLELLTLFWTDFIWRIEQSVHTLLARLRNGGNSNEEEACLFWSRRDLRSFVRTLALSRFAKTAIATLSDAKSTASPDQSRTVKRTLPTYPVVVDQH